MLSKQPKENSFSLKPNSQRKSTVYASTETVQARFQRYISHCNALQQNTNIIMALSLMQSIHKQQETLIKETVELFPSSKTPPFEQLQIKSKDLDSKCQQISLKNLQLFARILNIREYVVSCLNSQAQIFPGYKKQLSIITSQIRSLRDHITKSKQDYLLNKSESQNRLKNNLKEMNIDKLMILSKRIQALYHQCNTLKKQLLLLRIVLSAPAI